MTNGEKIKAMFPSMEVGFITDLQVGIYFVKNQHSATVFSLEWWNAEYKEPSNSEKPNRLVEEKCPCYHCEYFEIKGWSHCKIHEDAYGDSRCNDYRKANQGSNKVNQCLNKSEIPTGSTTKNDLGVDCMSRQFQEIVVEYPPEDLCTYPEYKTIGGYIKVFTVTAENKQKWWDELSNEDKQAVMSLPNFDVDKFYQCTEIRINSEVQE